MGNLPDTTQPDRLIEPAVDRRFSLTLTFVVGSIVLLIAAGIAADRIGRRAAEGSTIRLGTKLAELDAQLIGDGFRRVMAASSLNRSDNDTQVGVSAIDRSNGSADPLIRLLLLIGDEDLESLFSSIDFHHMGILTSEGDSIWEIGSHESVEPSADTLDLVASGQTVSWLNRNVDITGADREAVSADLLESLVPLSIIGDGSNGFVFHYVSDITETFETNVAATRSEIRNKILIMLGILLGILTLLVFSLDLRISNHNRAVIANERTIREELDTRNIELQKADESKNEFLSSISHELKTPLATILAFARILKNNEPKNLETKQVEQLEIINRNVIRLDVLINDLLDLSRIQAKTIRLTMEETEISDLVERVVEGFEPTLSEAQQSVDLNVEHEKAWMIVDPTRIAQVMDNLISNASKYSSKGSRMIVTSRREDNVWILSIKDKGSGISTKDLPQVFLLFYRTPEAVSSSVPGTGIGLYVSKQIVELHGGKIGLESAPGTGTTVTLTLSGLRDAPSDSSATETALSNTLERLDNEV